MNVNRLMMQKSAEWRIKKRGVVTYSPENKIQIVVNERIIKPFYLMFIRSFTGFFVNCIL